MVLCGLLDSVWFAIQQALEHAGFVVADVRTLDKQQETYKQSIQKLVIHYRTPFLF